MSTENNISRKTRDRLYTGSQWFVYLRVLHNNIILIHKHRFDSKKMPWVKYRFKNTILAKCKTNVLYGCFADSFYL